jgi:cytochrome d ubiquinol oxidase subunit I
MVYIGGFLLLLTFVGLYLLRRGTIYTNRLFLLAALLSIPLPQIANQLGWISAEVGRQPWIVYGELKTSEAFSHVVPGGQVLFSLVMFILIYALLFALWLYLIVRQIKKGPSAFDESPSQPKEVQS